MSIAFPLPKDQIRIVLLEGIADTAVNALTTAGFTNVEQVAGALDGPALIDALKDARIVGIRSRTKLTEEMLSHAGNLIAIGCFSVGTNQVDLRAARGAGIPVFNAPFSNTRSVAELTIAEIIMLFRGIIPKSTAAHVGQWRKTANGAREVRGKVLGVVGYGNIGSQLALLAEAMGMRVRYFDHTDKLQHGNVEGEEHLHDLLGMSDVISLHVPDTPDTRSIIGEAEIRAMKPGAFLINNARGSLVDLEALAAALKDGHLGGAAIDVFPVEPSSNDAEFLSPLRGLDNVILTPHVGGSTEEAQRRIGAEVARKFVDYIDVGSTTGAVDFPQVQLPITRSVTRFIQVQRNLPGELKRLNDVFASRSINIVAQHYQTDGEIGYVVLDAGGDIADADAVLAEIRGLEGTIRTRIVQ
jgi:D-3-phosphoglycerate dehydrogenase